MGDDAPGSRIGGIVACRVEPVSDSNQEAVMQPSQSPDNKNLKRRINAKPKSKGGKGPSVTGAPKKSGKSYGTA